MDRGRAQEVSSTRSGLGFDLHPLVEGRPLVLGGVAVPYERGLGGHSDADVLTHAVCEALLGAMALGDLGRSSRHGSAWKECRAWCSRGVLTRCVRGARRS